MKQKPNSHLHSEKLIKYVMVSKLSDVHSCALLHTLLMIKKLIEV